MSVLFSPVEIGPITLPNRIVIAPMCQYSADDGCTNDWHRMHLMQFAISGAGLIMLEATHVTREARITHGCLGLYNDANKSALAQVMAAARQVALPGTRWGIQISHAGRKASAQRPWEGRGALAAGESPWPTEAPSAIAGGRGWPVPNEMSSADIARTRDAFVAAAKRAVRLGFDVVELHAARGYLIHQFLTPLANHREDAYGGTLENRMRFGLELVEVIRQVVPPNVTLGLRITGSDWVPDGITIDEAVAFASAVKALGIDYVCVSSGGAVHAKIPVVPGYQVPLAAAVKQQVKLPTRAVGMIFDPQQAETIVATGQADMVALARAMLDDPRWVWHAAERLGATSALRYPVQYERASPVLWPGAELARPV